MTNKKQPKAKASNNVVTEKSYRTPFCSVNYVIIMDFENEMETLKLTRESSVNNIMLALYKKHGTNLNPHALSKQICDFKNLGKVKTDKDYCKCSPGSISWYKSHYKPELNKFDSNKEKRVTKQDLLDKLYAVPELKDSPFRPALASLPMRELERLVTNYELA